MKKCYVFLRNDGRVKQVLKTNNDVPKSDNIIEIDIEEYHNVLNQKYNFETKKFENIEAVIKPAQPTNTDIIGALNELKDMVKKLEDKIK